MFADAGIVVVVHYRGLSVGEMTHLREQVRAAGASLRVAKNRLAKIALRDRPCAGVAELLSGPTAIAFAAEPVGIAKVLCAFAKEHENLVVLGGAMGEAVLDAQRIEALSKLPSLDELRGTLVGLLQAPATKIVRTLAEPGGLLARVLAAKGSS